MAAERTLPADFHALYDSGVRAQRGATEPGLLAVNDAGSFPEQAGDLTLSYDDATGLPNRVVVAAPAGRRAENAAQSASPEEAARQFLAERGDLWRLSEADAAGIEVTGVSGSGLRTVQLVQRVDGTEVFNSDVTAAVGPANQLVAVAGQFFPGAADAPAARGFAAGPATSTEEAIARAVGDLTGLAYLPAEFALNNAETDDEYRFYDYRPEPESDRPGMDRQVRVKDVLFPLGGEQFAAAYYLELWVKGWPAFSYVIDAVEEPDVLFRRNLAADFCFSYRVYNTGDAILRPEDGPAPGTPHPTGQPDGFQAPIIDAKLIETEGLLKGDPWLPADATTTDGNNCIAYADLKAGDGFNTGDIKGQVTAPATFDHAYDNTKPASAPENVQASVVGMFFHVNWLHDRWYEAGFDEAAGNAQKDNYGRGGRAGDPILAEGNDFSGTDNANMATPADGSSPRMQMYEFKGVSPLPSRTSNFDALITFHEMGHYITNRLVGNAAGLTNQQGGAMGEGWGDFFAISMTSQETDDFERGVFAVGGWTDITSNFDNNYYFSIRRYPYTADLGKNPLTLKHISANVLLPAGPIRNPTSGGPNNEVHNAGEVWCAILWEVFVNLVAAHGHAEGERRMLEYVVGGLKLTPSRPTFNQARDGIITTVSVLNAADLVPVWAGFAKRGMGVDAVSPASSSTSLTGVVESFESPVL
ncbi:MAG: M36 family metallopeptidase [Nakamurella sp.]